MQRTMLAAVHATEQQVIAFRYMIQISSHPAFFTKCELFAVQSTCRHILDAFQTESNFFSLQKHSNGTLFGTGGFHSHCRRI